MTYTSETSRPVDAAASARARAARLIALALICLAQLMITLDSTIVSVALPSVQRSIGLSDGARQWALTAYTLAFGSLLLLGGRIADLVGRKRTMLIGVTGFALASALGGAAVNAPELIGARALQGIFAALIAPSTLSLVTATFTEAKERGRALSIYTAAMMTGGGLGLILGGLLTTYLGWRWCLYVNLPVAAAVVVAGARLVPNPPGDASARLDVPGAVLSSTGMLALIYALGEASTFGWGSGAILGSLAAAMVLLAGFVGWQARASRPLLPLRVLTNRDSGAAFLAFVISAFCTYGMLLGMTYQLQTVMQYSPLRAGLAFLAYVGTAVVWSTQVASRLVRRFRPGLLIAVGLLVFAVALLLLTRLSPTSTYPAVLPALLLFGIGVGTITVPAITVVVAVNDPRDHSVCSAIVNSSQQAGASIGAALLNTISVAAAAAYVARHGTSTGTRLHAAVHGLAVSSRWGALVAVVGAVIAVTVIRVDARKVGRS
jgi:EmrB/QacA subfamily drug resistance transporter